MRTNPRTPLASKFRALTFLALLFTLPKSLAQNDCGDLVDAAAELAPIGCVRAADVTLSSSSSITSVNLRDVETVSGDLELRGDNLDSFEASSLVEITGDFTIQSSKLSRLNIPKPFTLGGGLLFELSDSPLNNVNLSLSNIATNTDFAFNQSPNIERISLLVTPTAEAGNRSLVINTLYALSTLQIQGAEFSTVNITATSLTSIPDIWPPAAQQINLFTSGLLGNLSIGTVTVESSLVLSGIGSPSVAFPDLTTIGGNFDLIQTDTVELSLPQLRSVAGGFTISINDKLDVISVEALEGISNLAIANNSILADISFPALTTLDILALQYNDRMPVLDLERWFPKLSQVSEYIILQGQIENVTFPNLQNGVGIKAPTIAITSSVELDCNAVRAEVIAKQAIRDIVNFQCTSGPKGSKPSETGSRTPTSSPSSPTTSNPGGGSGSNSGSKTNIGAIVGGTIGGVLFLIIIATLAWFYRRRSKPQNEAETIPSSKVGGIEEHVGGIDDQSRGTGGISSK